jgi:hypothetical protein
MPRQIHIYHNVRPDRTGHVREAGAAEAGMKFFRDRAATDERTTFHDQGFESRLGQIERRDQPVMPCSENDYIASFRHREQIPHRLKPVRDDKIKASGRRPEGLLHASLPCGASGGVPLMQSNL